MSFCFFVFRNKKQEQKNYIQTDPKLAFRFDDYENRFVIVQFASFTYTTINPMEKNDETCMHKMDMSWLFELGMH